MNQPNHLFENFPPDLQPLAQQQWHALDTSLIKRLPHRAQNELPTVLMGSDFVAHVITNRPQALTALIQNESLWRSYASTYYETLLQQALGSSPPETLDENQFNQIIRHLRNQEYIRMIWRDLLKLASTRETMQDLSNLADAMVRTCIAYHQPKLINQWGKPVSAQGSVQELIVIAMGKLGAQELNLSSDIDLMFFYPEDGNTDGSQSVTNQEFFTRLGQKVIHSLSHVTCDGFVFRVDMRLRPYGQSGALVTSFNAMEIYYQQQGRPWERYALIKARVLTGDENATQDFTRRIRPFVYRRYIDYGVITALREIKELITREVLRKHNNADIKVGAGGIREIEFIVQAFQLIHGGHEPRLQTSGLLKALKTMLTLRKLPESVCEALKRAYLFLRDVEHRLQALSDRQTHSLPQDELQQKRLACLMGYRDWASFLTALESHRVQVKTHFDQMVTSPVDLDEVEETQLRPYRAWWFSELSDEQIARLLQTTCFKNPDAAHAQIKAFQQAPGVRQAQPQGRERLDKLMPRLLRLISRHSEADLLLTRILLILEQIVRRSAYLALLVEHVGTLERLIQLCAVSMWVAEQLTKFPALLGELLQSANSDFANDLRQQLTRVPEDDLETQMEILREFKNARIFHVAVAEMTGQLSLIKASDYLTEIARVVINAALNIAWTQLVNRYGYPDNSGEMEFLIIAYGKLGSAELGYGSDLDLVFLYDTQSDEVNHDKETFYTRLGQRMIHILSTASYSGRLYEVDTRLRPFGEGGLLVNRLSYFEQYLKSNAWTWEHQALVRACAIAGSPKMKTRFNAIREEILTTPRPEATLRVQVMEMREKMIRHLTSNQPEAWFDIKQDPGGLVDIEFLTQYGVLLWAHHFPHLTLYTSVINLLEALARLDLLSPDDALALKNAYRDYRAAGHKLVLQKQKTQVDKAVFQEHRAEVERIWKTFVCGASTSK